MTPGRTRRRTGAVAGMRAALVERDRPVTIDRAGEEGDRRDVTFTDGTGTHHEALAPVVGRPVGDYRRIGEGGRLIGVALRQVCPEQGRLVFIEVVRDTVGGVTRHLQMPGPGVLQPVVVPFVSLPELRERPETQVFRYAEHASDEKVQPSVVFGRPDVRRDEWPRDEPCRVGL